MGDICSTVELNTVAKPETLITPLLQKHRYEAEIGLLSQEHVHDLDRQLFV